jgi:uncharacterized protein YjgD (DUF1641 family)
MENQHRKITGYRELSQEDIDLMNKIKEIGIELSSLIQSVTDNGSTDMRWVNTARTALQTGLMQLTRSIAQPTTF